MIDWLNLHVHYWHWIVFGLILAASEIFVPSFVFLWIGISAVIVGITLSAVALTFNTQLILWMVLSILCLVAWFKYGAKMMQTRSLSGMALEELIGQSATVVAFNNETGHGRVKFSVPIVGSEQWDIICEDQLVLGDRVSVTKILGNKLLAKKH